MDKWEKYAAETAKLIENKQLISAYQLLKKAAKAQKNDELLAHLTELKKEMTRFDRRLKKGLVHPQEIEEAALRLADRLYYLIYCLETGGLPAAAESLPPEPVEAAATNPARPKPIEEPIAIIDASDEADRPSMSGDAAASIRLPQKSAANPKPVKNTAKPKASKPQAQKVEEGGILYNIPNEMPLGLASRCIVRLAFDKTQLKKETDTFTDEVIKTIQVSEIMEVDLIDLSGESAFDIQFISSKEQILDRSRAAEWLIMVKPLKSGQFSLALRVSMIEQIDGKERRRELILEEVVAVVNQHVATGGSLKAPPQSFITDAPFFPTRQNPHIPNSPTSSNASQTILFMGANPPNTRALALEVEHSRIAAELALFPQFRLPTEKFLAAVEIPKLFIKYRPHIIHFSGHGKDPNSNEAGETGTTRGIAHLLPKDYEKTGGIVVFDDDRRGMKIVEDKALDFVFRSAVEKLKIPIQVVVFNSCFSESQAKVIGQVVPYVIGTARAIEDDIAIAFSTGFYFGLAQGQSIEEAFVSGKMQAVLTDTAAENLILLYKNGEKEVL
jgi:hypothetical protein